MKIAILTLKFHTNYGGILQGYALSTVLKRMGHEVSFISSKLHSPSVLTSLFLFFKRVLKNMMGQPTPIVWEGSFYKARQVLGKDTKKFVDSYMTVIQTEHFEHLKSQYGFEVIIVGSDQVWRPKYSDVRKGYLAFAKDWDVKRIVYAASFGTDEWEYTPEQTEMCKELVKLFDAVSVRESSGVKLCKEHFGVNAEHVLDPTMLLDKEDYIALCEEADTPQSPGTLMTYILDNTARKADVVERIAKAERLVPFSALLEDFDKFMIQVLDSMKRNKTLSGGQPPVEQWLRGFQDAELIITDSFHACVFSLLFHKPFVMIINEGRGAARFNSLVNMFHLEPETLESGVLRFNPDYNLVDTLLENYRVKSMKFLKSHI